MVRNRGDTQARFRKNLAFLLSNQQSAISRRKVDRWGHEVGNKLRTQDFPERDVTAVLLN